MEHHLQFFGNFILEKVQAIAVGFPVMDHDRQVQGICQIALLFQTQQLHFLRLVFLPIIIQPDFPDGHHFCMLPGQPFQFGNVAFVFDSGQIFRMPAYCGIHKIILLRHVDGCNGRFIRGALGDDRFHIIGQPFHHRSTV